MVDIDFDEPLLRSVAALQAQCRLLDSQGDVLTELADMQAQRQLRVDLDEYIAAHSTGGTLPNNPLEVIAERIEKLSNLFSDLNIISESGYNISGQDLPLATLEELKESLIKAEQARSDLPKQAENARQQIDPLDWGQINGEWDLHPELLLCADILSLELPSISTDRNWIFLLSKGDDGALKEPLEKLEICLKRKRQLIETHEQHRQALDKSSEATSEGNYRTACRILTDIGIRVDNPEGFRDLPYAKVGREISDIKNRINEIEECCACVTDISHRIKSRLGNGAGGYQEVPSGLMEDMQNSKNLSRQLGGHAGFIRSYTGSELEAECKPDIMRARKLLMEIGDRLKGTSKSITLQQWRPVLIILIVLLLIWAVVVITAS